MKTLKISTLLVALASVFTFSSCLDESEDSSLPAYTSYVTIAGDAAFGYTFYSDFGCTLKPTASSIQTVLPGLSTSNVKRALVAFNLLNEAEQGQALVAGKTYDIELGQSYYANYAIPTYQSIEISHNSAAADTLTTKNEMINTIDKNIWAINGYVNAQLTINYDQSKPFYLNTYYDREKDIDPETSTLYLNLYFNNNSTNDYYQGTSVFSFDLPDDAAFEFMTDSVNVVLRAINTHDNQLMEVGKCRMGIDDFFVPSF